jgi:hypothetical protein
MPIDLGTTTTARWARGPALAGHTVTLTVTRPDGTVLTPTVTEQAGVYSAPVVGSLPGRYLLTWADTTDNATRTDTLEVWPADPRFIISEGDAFEALGWNAASIAKNGPALRLYIATATHVIEDIVGTVLIRTIVQPADGGRTGVLLWERPASIDSVTVDGEPTTNYIVNVNAAILYAKPAGSQFPPGLQNIIVTYKTGGTGIAPNIQLAARELVRHLWQVGQQVPAQPGPTGDYAQQPMGMTPSGFAVPKRVLELCRPTYSLPGMA